MQSNRKIRLFAWILNTMAVLGEKIVWHFQPHSWGLFLLIIANLAVILGLLSTTPADAIRLPRWVSESLIVITTIVFLIADRKIESSVQLAITVVMLVLLRLGKRSPWWAVIVAWFPT